MSSPMEDQVGHSSSSATSCGWDKFRETVEHRRRAGVWMLNGVIASPSSTTGIPLNLNESELLEQLKRNASPYPIKRRSNSCPSPATRLSQNWNFSDQVFLGECRVTGCGMKFQGRRVNGWIALYVYGNHSLHDDSPKRGLKGEAKARADAAVLSGRRSDSLFDEFHRESASNRKKVLSSESIEDPNREKRKLENRMTYVRRKQKLENGTFDSSVAALIEACKNHATTIGDFYEEYKYLQGYPTNMDDDCDPLRFVHILEHDVGERPDGQWNFIFFTVTSAARTARLAADLCKNRPLGVQVEIDFASRYFLNVNKDIHQAGMTVVSDCQRVAHPLVFCIAKSEDSLFAGKLLDFTEALIKHAGGTIGKCLKDGGTALSAACLSRHIMEVACVAHESRGGFQRMAGFHGSKGSLPKYLATQGVKLPVIKTVMSIYFAFQHLTTIPDYVAARGLFLEEQEKHLPPHVFSHYFREIPRSGAAAHEPTEVGSTQGLEKTWGTLRRKQKDAKKALRSPYISFFEGLSSRERTVKPFSSKVMHTVADWVHIIRFSTNAIGEEFLYAVYYDSTSGELIGRETAIGNAFTKPYVVYLPMPHFMREIFESEKLRADRLTEGARVGFLADQRTLMESNNSNFSIMQSCPSMQVACISSMHRYLQDNNSNVQENETLVSFLRRRSIRESSKVDMWKREAAASKKKEEMLDAQQHRLELEARKWQTNVESNLLKELEECNLEDGDGSQCDFSEGEDEELTDAEKQCIVSMVNELRERKVAYVKESPDKDSASMVGRALGHFHCVEVSSTGTRCNCEYFRTKGWCDEQRIYDLVEFNIFPPTECQLADGTSWPNVALNCKQKLKQPLFNEMFPNEVKNGLHPPPSSDPGKTLSKTPYYDVILPVSSEGKLLIKITKTVRRDKSATNAYHSCFAGYSDTNSAELQGTIRNKLCIIRNVGDEIVAIDGKNLRGMAITEVLEILRGKKNHRSVHIQLMDIRVEGGSSKVDRRNFGCHKDDANYD